MLLVENQRIIIDTKALYGEIANGQIVSLKSKQTGQEWIKPRKTSVSSLQMVYGAQKAVDVISEEYGHISLFQVTNSTVEMRIKGWEGSGVIVFTEDIETGELCIEPSAYSDRHGLRSVRYSLFGLNKKDFRAVAPLWQGVRLELDDELINPSWNEWPFRWEAGFVIFEGAKDSLMLWTQDTHYTPKALSFSSDKDGCNVSIDTQTYGPIENNTSAGGLIWRLGTYLGDWHAPALVYRKWLYDSYDLDKKRPWKPDWMKDISLCISWLPNDESILDELARYADPQKTLLHFPDWRDNTYDPNYPVYKASVKGASLIRKARKMSYHIAPHANIMEIDPAGDMYSLLGQFAYRDLETDRRFGWSVDNKGMRSVPMDNRMLQNSGSCYTMVKLHAAQPMWHSVLRESLQKVIEEFNLDCIFTDVSHVTFNLRNCLINNQTTMEGVKRLQNYLTQIHGGMEEQQSAVRG